MNFSIRISVFYSQKYCEKMALKKIPKKYRFFCLVWNCSSPTAQLYNAAANFKLLSNLQALRKIWHWKKFKKIDFFKYRLVCCSHCQLASLAGSILYNLLAYDAHWSLSRPAAAILPWLGCCSRDSPGRGRKGSYSRISMQGPWVKKINFI